MITIAIIAIIVSIALPSYNQYVTRAKIQEATSALLAQRTKLEQFFQDQRTYAGACVNNTVAALPTGLKYFTITCPTLNATQYVVRADGGIAGGDQSMAGFRFEINEANIRTTPQVPTAAGWSLPSTNCWVSKKPNLC
jgi:type IV pilus assembly protein PilE